MSALALPSHYISASTVGTMYGGHQQQTHGYDPSKIYDTTKSYENMANSNNAAAAYMWQSPFKYDSLTPNWPTTAAANATNAWYSHQAQGLSLGQIVKPELHDYTR